MQAADLGKWLKATMRCEGPWNCSTEPADWCMALGHPDFAAAWRDTIAPADCAAAQEMAGGLLAHWEHGIGGALPVVTDFQMGDIAVVQIAGMTQGAIYTGQRWAIRGERIRHFLTLDPDHILKAWRP